MTEQEGLKEQIQAIIAGRGDGIDLDTPFHWVIKDVKQPAQFFEHLPRLLPQDSILYVEGNNIASEVGAFYSSHRAGHAVNVARDTIWPVPDIYHFTFSQEVSDRLRQFAENRPTEEMFDHIKAYQKETLLFTFHDAFVGFLRISERLPDEAIARFCGALGVTRYREETKQRDPNQLRQILRAMENPDKVRFAGEPWWERLKRKWLGK